MRPDRRNSWIAPRTVGRLGLLLLLSLLLTILLAHQGLHFYRQSRAGMHASALEKTRYYSARTDEFNVIYLGDSRTYCGIHPTGLDSLLGTRSVNLSMFAHWLPTQYAQFRQLVPLIPPKTTVVWSLGHTNFRPIGERWWNADTHPLTWRHMPAFLRWGYPKLRLLLSLPPLYSMAQLRHWCRIGYTKFRHRLQRPLWSHGTEGRELAAAARVALPYTPVAVEQIDHLIEQYSEDPCVARVTALRDGDLATSLEILRVDGAYYRVELVSEFFRDKQREHETGLVEKVAALEAVPARLPSGQRFKGLDEPDDLPHPAFWATFTGILDLFADREVTLIVNEMCEAPYTYVTEARRQGFRAFLREEVRAEVERRGHVFITVDFTGLEDADFFDYNHLNSRGIAKYTPLLAEALRPYIVTGED